MILAVAHQIQIIIIDVGFMHKVEFQQPIMIMTPIGLEAMVTELIQTVRDCSLIGIMIF